MQSIYIMHAHELDGYMYMVRPLVKTETNQSGSITSLNALNIITIIGGEMAPSLDLIKNDNAHSSH